MHLNLEIGFTLASLVITSTSAVVKSSSLQRLQIIDYHFDSLRYFGQCLKYL